MLTILAIMLAGAPQEAPAIETIEGRCDYPSELGRAKASEIRVECDAVVLAQGRFATDILVQFAGKRSGMPVGFAGAVDGDTMTVRRIYPRPGVVVSATGGHCRIFYARETISGVSCVGRAGSKSYVANFRAFAP